MGNVEDDTSISSEQKSLAPGLILAPMAFGQREGDHPEEEGGGGCVDGDFSPGKRTRFGVRMI